MNYDFDNLARAIASGISRREALKRMGAGLAGLLLTTMGIRKANAAITCGTCQACDLDTFTCGTACTPATAGQTLCDTASQNGSYLRLLSYLTSHGFEASGMSNSLLIYQKGALYQSAMGVILQHSSIENQEARLSFLVSPAGDITSSVVVVNSGSPIYGLGVDASGRVVQTIASVTTGPTSTQNGTPSSLSQIGLHPDLGPVKDQALCLYAGAIACGALTIGLCWLIGEAACVAGGTVSFGTLVIPCSLFVNALCSEGGILCGADLLLECACPLNIPACNGICCDPCQDCLNGSCVPGKNVASCASKVCCGGQCCAEGLVCDPGTSTCKSPDSACTGAFCGGFIDCSATEDCQCYTIAEGGGQCAHNEYCDEIATCVSSADCGAGQVCAIGSCCEIPVCIPICTPTIAATAQRQVLTPKKDGRRTSAHR